MRFPLPHLKAVHDEVCSIRKSGLMTKPGESYIEEYSPEDYSLTVLQLKAPWPLSGPVRFQRQDRETALCGGKRELLGVKIGDEALRADKGLSGLAKRSSVGV